jgi:hypothetical protein
MSLAARTREAARRRPWLLAALGAGVVNYTAAARSLDVEGDVEAVATALRRYAADLDPPAPPASDATVSMHSGIERVADGDDGDAVLSVGEAAFRDGDGPLTAVTARGTGAATALSAVLGRLAAEDVPVEAAGVGDEHLTVVVGRRHGADAVRVLEGALSDER